ncbi:ABC transporter substrate-binding protein [Streptomyces hokutonensis]|uniref:ABC transporter substrate-binding protein n=1 Tax=Streptomyces hokutonensis TaxID=1306990 RepID=UPI0037FDCF92
MRDEHTVGPARSGCRSARSLHSGALALATAGALLLAGCSSSSGDSSNSSSSGSEAATSTGTAAGSKSLTPNAALIASIKPAPKLVQLRGASNATIVYGSSLVAPPDAFLAPDGKTAVGWEIDLINAIGRKMGSTMQARNLQFPTLITSLTAGRIKLIISEMSDSKERQKQLNFVDYYTASLSFLVAKGNPKHITTPAGLCGKNVAVLPGSSQLYWAQGANSGLCGSHPMKLVQFSAGPTQALNSVRTGRVDVYLSENDLSGYTAEHTSGLQNVTLAHSPLSGVTGIGVPKSDRNLLNAVQQALQQLLDDGTYTKIISAWQAQSGAITKATVNGATS